MTIRTLGSLLTLLLVALATAPAQAGDTPAPATIQDGAVVWAPTETFQQTLLTIETPDGVEMRRSFGAAEIVRFDPADVRLADGFHAYEIVVVLAEMVEGGQGQVARQQTGSFEVRDGRAVDSPIMAQVFATDVVVQGSLCVGTDCAAAPSFGFDTIQLQENNIRIKFDDTSNSASFPANDWEITINDTTNGGASYFGITDATAGRRIVSFAAGAPANSLTVDSAGDIGIGTDNAVVEVHVVDGDTPTLRLEQNGSAGFGARTWDVAGNETNFFVRDVAGGSALPFKILPNAQSDDFVIGPAGIGMGIRVATAALHVRADNAATPAFRIDVPGTTPRAAMTVDGQGNTVIGGTLTGTVVGFPRLDVLGGIVAGADFSVTGNGGPLRIYDNRGTPSTADDIDLLKSNRLGNMIIAGTLVQGSSRTIKEEILPVDPSAVLRSVAALPINTWQYIGDTDSRHLGPMAEDFYAAFGLGDDDAHIAPGDAAGVALGAIQALALRSEEDRARADAAEARVRALEAENEALAARLARIEALLLDAE